MRSLRVDVIVTALVGVAAVACLALVARADLPLSGLYPVTATACFAIIAAVVVVRSGRSHPFARFGPANRVTIVRAALVALIAGAIGEAAADVVATAVVATSLLVTVLDGIDGWLARRAGMESDFGARFDMEIDALLILVLAILVWRWERAGAWVVWSGLLRYVFLGAGWLLPWMRRPLPDRFRRKAICVVQIGGLILAIVPIIPSSSAAPIAGLGLCALVYSFVVDTVWLWRSHGREQVA